MISEEEFKKVKDDIGELKKILAEFISRFQGSDPLEKSNKEVSFGDFAREKNPKDHNERTLTIACYIWKTQNKNFTYKDLEDYCKRVAWPMYSNYTILINRLKSKGFIEEVGKTPKGEVELRILDYGIKFVENNFKIE